MVRPGVAEEAGGMEEAGAGDEDGGGDCGSTSIGMQIEQASNMQYRLDLLKYAAFRFNCFLLRRMDAYFCVDRAAIVITPSFLITSNSLVVSRPFKSTSRLLLGRMAVMVFDPVESPARCS